MRRSETRRIIADYAREKLRAELKGKPYGTRAELARMIGVERSTLTGFLGTESSAPRGAGEDLLGLLAKFWNVTPAKLEADALDAAKTTSAPDAYPNRRESARICLAGGLRADAVNHVLEEVASYPTDPPVLFWIRKMLLTADWLNAQPPKQPKARKVSA